MSEVTLQCVGGIGGLPLRFKIVFRILKNLESFQALPGESRCISEDSGYAPWDHRARLPRLNQSQTRSGYRSKFKVMAVPLKSHPHCLLR
jgi:hypothetical protein